MAKLPVDSTLVLYDVDPVVLVPLTLLIVVLSASYTKAKKRLSLHESLVAWWYLFNGVIIHIFLDG